MTVPDGVRFPPTLGYQVVDVFTGTAYAGNPLAVVLDADELSTGQLQALAREFNLSETAYPMVATDRADYRLRIFTPSVELPFAGHPSVGAAWLLHSLGRLPAGDVVQSCGAGRLAVTVSADGAMLTGGPPSWGHGLDPGPLLDAVGLTAGDLVGVAPRWCGAGLDFGYLLVHPGALARARPDQARLAVLGGAGVSVTAWDGRSARSRVFAGGVGVVEDLAGLEGRGLEHCAGDVTLVHVPGQANQGATGVGPPVWGEQAGEGRHEVGTAVVLDRGRQLLDLGR